jgi:RES domain-containing protein
MSQLDVTLGKVVDVRDAPALDALEVTSASMVSEHWDDAQRVGGATAWLGFAGILVPSARHGDGNLVIFVNNLAPDDRVTVRSP